MQFTTLPFFALLPAALLCFALAPAAHRVTVLVFASICALALVAPWYSFALCATCVAVHFIAPQLASRPRLLPYAVTLALLPLVFVKFAGSYSMIAFVGLSYSTFVVVGYFVDVARARYLPSTSLLYMCFLLFFFPALTAGPIVRGGDILSQLPLVPALCIENFVHGMRRFIWGLFQKVVIADFAAVVVHIVYDVQVAPSAPAIILGTAFFAIQLYYDFCGYSDMALGTAAVFGIRLPENFATPYAATSLQDFWRRWHMSLTSWLRDYVYIPLGGSRGTLIHTIRNILLVFLASGLWHGSGILFVLWGLCHGTLLALRVVYFHLVPHAAHRRCSWPLQLLQRLRTVSIVTALWVLFRSADIMQATTFYWRTLQWGYGSAQSVLTLHVPSFATGNLGLGKVDLLLTIVSVCAAMFVRYASSAPWFQYMVWSKTPLRFAAYIALTLAIIFFGRFEGTGFVYYQF